MTAQTAVDDLFARYSEATRLRDAEAVLEEIARLPGPDAAEVGECFEDLADAAVDQDDYATAVRLQQRAVEHGSPNPRLAREMLAWYLLKDGQAVAGEAEFEALLRETGRDPVLLLTIGNARSDAGRERDALAGFDEALATAKRLDDPGFLDEVRGERKLTRKALGLSPDEDDRAAPRWGVRRRFEHMVYAVGWFPPSERKRAARRWPELAAGLPEGPRYPQAVERHLRELLQETGQRPGLAPLDVDRLVEFAADRGLDPGEREARAQFAAELYRRGEAIPWPPARNESCWCGSERKYKRCCGQA